MRGDHQMAVGGSLAYWQFHFLSHARSGGNWTFNGQATGLGLADLLMGQGRAGWNTADPRSCRWTSGMRHSTRRTRGRATSRITINAGVRWEPYFGQSVLNGSVYNFSLDNFKNNVKTKRYVNAPAGLIYPGDAGFPPGRIGLNKQWLNLSPRVGVAWDVSGDGRTAVRGSYGLAYDLPNCGIRVDQRATRRRSATARSSKIRRADSIIRTRISAGIRTRFSRVATRQFIPYGAFGAVDPGHQLAAHPAVERHGREAAGTRLAGGSELYRQLHGPACGTRWRSIPACSSASVRARSTASSIRPAARTGI